MKREQQPLTSEFNIERFFFVKIKGVGNLLGKKSRPCQKRLIVWTKRKERTKKFFSRNCCYLKNWPWISSEKSSGYKEKISLCMKLMSAFSMKEKPFWLVDKGSWSTFQYLVLFPSSIFLRLNFFLDLYSSVVRFGKVWKTKRKPELAFISLKRTMKHFKSTHLLSSYMSYTFLLVFCILIVWCSRIFL